MTNFVKKLDTTTCYTLDCIILVHLSLPVLTGSAVLPALNMAICWEPVTLSQSAGNLIDLGQFRIFRDYTPKSVFCNIELINFCVFIPTKPLNKQSF